MTIQHAGSALALLSTLFCCPPVTNADDGASKVRTVSVPGGGKPVVAKTDEEGAIHLLHDSPDGPKYARSTDNGVTFGEAIPVVEKGSRQNGLEFSGSDMAQGRSYPRGGEHERLEAEATRRRVGSASRPDVAGSGEQNLVESRYMPGVAGVVDKDGRFILFR